MGVEEVVELLPVIVKIDVSWGSVLPDPVGTPMKKKSSFCKLEQIFTQENVLSTLQKGHGIQLVIEQAVGNVMGWNNFLRPLTSD